MADPAPALAADAPPPFAVVVAAFNTFFLLATEAAQAACLRSVARLLAPGGVVVLECFVPGDPPPGARAHARAPDGRRRPRRAHRHRARPARRRSCAASTSSCGKPGTRLRPWVLRYATPAQLDDAGARRGSAPRRAMAAAGTADPSASADPMHVSIYGAR